MAAGETEPDPVSESLYEVDATDPLQRLVDRSEVPSEDVAQIGRLMRALSDLRTAEQRLSEASQQYMKLSQLDMGAIHYLIVAENRGATVTPGMLAASLEISAASTTKLLNRLEQGGHVTREVHPTDRRAFAVRVTPETAEAAMETVGRQQAKRFHSAAALSAREREVVIGFLQDMTQQLSLDDVAWAKGEGA
ncbi:MarR family transcriptional regulator [Nesterenkonia sp. AN1]|uniref:MarR family transcriptional regulator n=1 Tax=Nesterenkonia aurantiaca TaxID=1436010 RepID=A0A4R7G615_9MICC|nr:MULTISPECIES: MarR family transcriptional regulator [Nesterenkonia]EXF24001.1 MarR family transcriptional regulator [Nesterenkonia sp. AN1]TDS86914.1 MarR family transcriptional regulator [Nesterenkonia aurantiaca]